MSLADYIVVRSMTFVVPAVAAMVTGDKTAFYQCGFAGVQNTLLDDGGRHYFKRCSIQGAVDFIFVSGQSIYEDCSIQALGGFIPAQGRTNPNDANGFLNHITFAEYGNFGPGADTSKRVSWAKKLSIQSLEELTSKSFINSDN
uniref:pectinesterase n=1 Tax=Populus trichocarpa TaxID=3694 RepID=A0A2K2C6N9_POPTR